MILWRTAQSGSEETVQVNRQNPESKEKIIEYLLTQPEATSMELQTLTGLSRSGVEKILRQLKESGKIRRVGPDKGGHWEVLQ